MSLFFVFFAILLSPASADFLEEASVPFTRVDSSVELNEYPIARPLKGGSLRVLFIGRRNVAGPLSIHIAERLDCIFETVLTESRSELGIQSSAPSHEAEVLSGEAVEKTAGQLFLSKWDVIWLDFDFDALSEGFRLTILDRIMKGAGLVYVGDRDDLDDLKASGKVDDTQLEAVSFGKFTPVFGGKVKRGLITIMPSFNPGISISGYGDYLTSAVNAIMFASGRYGGLTVTKIPEPGKIIEQESIDLMNYRIHLLNKLDSKPMKVVARYRNENGGIEAETTTSYKIENWKSFVILEYPFLPVGTYSADISIADSEGVAAVAGISFTVTAQKHLTDLDFWEMSAPEGGLIIGRIKASVPFTEAMQLQVDLLDCRGRLIGRNDLRPKLNTRDVDFVFKIGRIKERSMTVQAKLIQSNRLVQKIRKPVFVRRQYDPRRFYLVVADENPLEALSGERYERLREAGVDFIETDISNIDDMAKVFEAVSQTASSGVGVIPRITGISSTVRGDIMDPVITTLDFNEDLENRVHSIVDTLRNISPFAYSLGRDNMLTPYDMDVSFSETDIESFHFFLESKYETVEELNRAWRTGFSSFDEAQPVKITDAERTGNFAAWLDTRLHMEDVFTQVHYGAFDAFTPDESGVLVGIEGFENAWNPFRGYNLFELTGFLSMIVSGQDAGRGLPGDISVSAALASFTQTGSFTGLSVGGESFRRGNETLLRAAPWQCLFMDMNSVWWGRAYGGVDAALTPQLTLSPAFSAVTEEYLEISGGIDILLRGSSRLVDTIGILYSPVSKMAARVTASAGSEKAETALSAETSTLAASNSVRSFFLACQDAGYTPMFVADDQLTGDWLTENNFSILILPYIQAMADETVQCIEKFVANGGAVIADMRTGIMDSHLFVREQGALDHLFGITQVTGLKGSRILGKFAPKEIEGGIPSGNEFDECLADPAVSVHEGVHVMGDVNGTPAVIVNRWGDGNAVFLNMGMESYGKLRAAGGESVFRNIISWCLFTGGAGLPYSSVRDSTGAIANKVNVIVFRDDVIEYIGILPDPLAMDSEYSRDDFRLDLTQTGKSYYVYDIRKSMFMGINSSIPLNLSPGKAELFALVPYRVKDIELKLKKSVVQIGGSLEYTVSVIPQSIKAKPGRHVFRVDVYGPDGAILPYLSESIEAEKGTGKSSLTITPGDSHGRWVLSVTDIISGKKAKRAFMVMATGSSILD